MHKLKFSLILLAVSVSLAACLKDNAFLDVSNTQPIIEFASGTNGASDLGNFGMNASEAQLDTAIALNIASPQVLNYPVTVTLKVDPTLINKYNSNPGNTELATLPDSTYQFQTTTVTIPAGHRIARIPITIYPSKINPVESYGLPIAIVSATGPDGQSLLVSGNAGVAFYAFIGNALAGNYTWDFTRYNGDTTTAVNGSSFTGQTTQTTTLTPTSLLFPDSYLQTFVSATAGIKLDFNDDNGVLSNFKVSFDSKTRAGLDATGFTIATAPVLLSYNLVGDASTGYKGSTFRIYFSLVNSSGGTRTLVDKFVKQ